MTYVCVSFIASSYPPINLYMKDSDFLISFALTSFYWQKYLLVCDIVYNMSTLNVTKTDSSVFDNVLKTKVISKRCVGIFIILLSLP